jgi:hypothetical protein
MGVSGLVAGRKRLPVWVKIEKNPELASGQLTLDLVNRFPAGFCYL